MQTVNRNEYKIVDAFDDNVVIATHRVLDSGDLLLKYKLTLNNVHAIKVFDVVAESVSPLGTISYRCRFEEVKVPADHIDTSIMHHEDPNQLVIVKSALGINKKNYKTKLA